MLGYMQCVYTKDLMKLVVKLSIEGSQRTTKSCMDWETGQWEDYQVSADLTVSELILDSDIQWTINRSIRNPISCVLGNDGQTRGYKVGPKAEGVSLSNDLGKGALSFNPQGVRSNSVLENSTSLIVTRRESLSLEGLCDSVVVPLLLSLIIEHRWSQK